MGVVLASILTIFVNKKDDNKILACLLLLYISLIEIINYYKYPVLQDYINIYAVLTLWMCICLYCYTEKDYLHKLTAVSIILPQIYYLSILYKPYLLFEFIPVWFLFNADTFFIYGVFYILYEQRTNFNFKNMEFKEFMINIGILFVLVLF